MTLLRLAHLSDPHLHVSLAAVPWQAWLGKRALSGLSWLRGRSELQQPALLAAAIADVHAHAPDHIAITGDVTNFSLPVEFKNAARWFATLGAPESVSVIPGNHDALVRVPQAQGWAHWQPWMTADDGSGLPYVRVRKGVALLGLSSAIPTAPGLASGTIGPDQLQWLAGQLAALKARDLFRVVMLHHPPADGVVSARKALTDRAALRAVLLEQGAELVLHGHSRDARADALPGPKGLIASYGLPSISAVPNPKDEGARWHLMEIERSPQGWHVQLTVRVWSTAQQAFTTAAEHRLVMDK